MGTPIKLDGSDGDIKEFTTSEENYLAYQIGLRLADAAKNTAGSLDDISRGGEVTVGTYTNTEFDQAVGTHPESGITITTTNKSLYQNTGTGTETGDNFKRPIHWNTALTPDAIQEMTDTNFNACIDRLLSTVFTYDYPGTFKLASSAPSGDYTAEISNIFTDTRTDGTAVNYSIFKRRTMTAPTTVRSIAIKRDDDSIKPDNFAGLQEMTDAEISETFGERAKTRISASLIGTYQLRSSADGVPTDAGTWVAKGTATDTRQQKGDVNYTRNSTSTSTTAFTGTYTGDFTGNFLGEYARNSTNTSTGNFAGSYTGDATSTAGSYTGSSVVYFAEAPVYFIGNYGATSVNYTSGSTRNSTNTFTGNFVGNYLQDYTGERSSTAGSYTGSSVVYFAEAPEYYTSNYGASESNYASTSTRNSTNTFTGDFVGNYATDYTGERSSTAASSTRSSAVFTQEGPEYYTGNFGGGATDYISESTINSTNTFTGNFLGNFAGDYTGERTSTAGSYTRSSAVFTQEGPEYYTGNYGGSESNYSGADFIGNYTGDVDSTRISTRTTSQTFVERIEYYLGNYTGNYIGDGNFAGNYIANYSSTLEYVGEYNFTGNYSSTSTSDFIGDFTGNFAGNYSSIQEYVGEYDFGSNYSSTSTSDFIGDFTGNYTGDYSSIQEYVGEYNFTANYSSASTSDFIGDFTGNYTGNYAGITGYVGVADYVGTSTSDFIGDFTGNYSSTSTRNSTDDFIGNYGQDYVGDFIGNYAGSTILATNETIETYTLYVRTA